MAKNIVICCDGYEHGSEHNRRTVRGFYRSAQRSYVDSADKKYNTLGFRGARTPSALNVSKRPDRDVSLRPGDRHRKMKRQQSTRPRERGHAPAAKG
jgi:hypothetical protein